MTDFDKDNQGEVIDNVTNNYDNNDVDNGDDASGDDDNSENTAEPVYDKANSLSFALLCRRMEGLWSLKRGKKSRTDIEKKQYLLPPTLLKNLEPQSVFPLFRILMPEIDNSRNAAMKERLIAQAYCDVEGFSKGTSNYEMLYGFTDPQKVPHQMAGDLSLVVQHIMSKRIPNQPSKISLGQMNSFLDDLANIAQRRRSSHNHEWRNTDPNKKKQKKETSASLREQWLRRVMAKGLSPLEHKWLVRILLQKMEFGLGWRAILTWYNPYAIELWNSHNSLKNLCDKLADPEYTQRRKEALAQKEALQQQAGIVSRWEPQDQPAALGNTISPMLSSRVFFADCMTKLEWNHHEYRKRAAVRDCLALQFPTICAEIKLDGERMVVHIKDGQVTMQTRNGKWYSQLYSPVLGPAIRRALSKYPVNVILDGEVESWDSGRQELIPFGNNRTVANGRRAYMQRHGLLEPIDQNLHADAKGTIADPNVMRISDDFGFVKPNKPPDQDDQVYDPGKDCWLQFIAFDILYVDGPDAKKLFQACLMDDDELSPGSIIHLTLLQRKLLLYQLLQEQPNEIEICKAVVIRSNGDCVPAENYFSIQNPLKDGEHWGAILDSTQTAIQDCMPANIQELDRIRRKGRNDQEINRLRAKAVETFYTTVVEYYKMEGLVLKDVASPYILGQASRSRKYWHKFKPDYEQGEGIDVVILGAFFATGLRHSGQLSHFLCGVVDESDPTSFMPALSVNGKSITYEKLAKIMEITGYHAATKDEPLQMGKWFEADEHRASLPDFISFRSYQRDMKEDFDGWTFSKKTYPDLWIRPEDSVVLELKGQEFVKTKELSAGLTMRFPRIKYVRHEAIDGGAKSAYEADTHRTLFQLYFASMQQRQAAAANDGTFSSSMASGQSVCRFLTPEEYSRKPKKRKFKAMSPSKVPKVEITKSQALRDVSFTVLEGNYSLEEDSLEAQDAKDNGWLEAALKVKTKEDVMAFILSHSGSIRVSAEGNENLIIGGKKDDARVVNFMKGLEYAKSEAHSKAKTKKALELKKMAENEGVLKWTFVFSIVNKWLAEDSRKRKQDADKNSKNSIKETCAWLLRPKPHEYLVRATSNSGTYDHIFDLRHSEDLSKMELLRALEDYKGKSDKETQPWQYVKSHSIDASDRWPLEYVGNDVWFDSSFSVALASESNTPMVYPDIFRPSPDHQLNEKVIEKILRGEYARKWHEVDDGPSDITSVLPLISGLGAILVPHVHADMTHCVCALQDGLDFACLSKASVKSFKDHKNGMVLLDALKSIKKEIVLISPEWVRSTWDKTMTSRLISKTMR